MCLELPALLSWLDSNCLHLLSTCCDRAYIDAHQTLRAVDTTRQVFAMVSATSGDNIEAYESVRERVKRFGVDSVLQYVQNLIAQVSMSLCKRITTVTVYILV